MKKQVQTIRNRITQGLGIGLLSLGLLAGVNPLQAQTTLIDPVGDGGFDNGSTFAANGWNVSNTANNAWYVGTPGAGAPMTANKAYISNDAGVTNGYATGTIANNYFWRDITVPSTDSIIQLSFDWNQQGETSWDIVQVFYAPITITPAATTVYPGSGTTNVPAAIAGATYIGNTAPNAAIQSSVFNLPKSLAGTTFRLIFSWKSDNSVGTQPPASLDNIALYSRPILTFISTTSGNFNAKSTWVNNALPAPTSVDTIQVLTGHTVTINAANQSVAKAIVEGTLDYASTPTSFTIVKDLTVNAGGVLNVFNGTTGKGLVVGGNITNDGTINLSVTGSLLNLNGTVAQTVGGSGTLTSNTIASLTFNNTNLTAPFITWNWTNVNVPTTLTFTRGLVSLGVGNSLTLGTSGTALGTLTYTSSNFSGFLNGKFGRWFGTTGTGTTIAAGIIPTFGVGSFPFINGNTTIGFGPAHFHRATAALTTAGMMNVEFTPDTGTVLLGIPVSENSLTYDKQSKAMWAVTSTNGYASTTNHSFAIQGSTTFSSISNNLVLLNAGGLVGTAQAGTNQPMVQRTAVPAANVDATYTIGLISFEEPIYTIASGAWNNPAIWNMGSVPVCGQSVIVSTPDSVYFDGSMATGNLGQMQVNGKLSIQGSTLNIGCTSNNNLFQINGKLYLSGGQVNLNGNISFISGSTFSQSGGTLTIDGNSGSTGTSVLSGTPHMNIATNLISLTGGTIIFVDGHIGTATADRALTYSPTVSPYPLITTGHTIQFGDGISTQANSTKGFETSLATRFYFGNVVVNTLASSNAFVASSSTTVIINGNLTVTAGEYRGGTTSQIYGGNITNNGTLTSTGTVTFGQVIQTNMATPTITSQTVGQTVSGSGVFRNSTTASTANFVSMTMNNISAAGVTFSSAAALLSGSNTGTVSGTLTFTNGIINTGSNAFILGISTTSLGTLALTSGGFGSGSTFSRWWGTAVSGQTITAGTIPTAGVGTYPFAALQSATPFSVFARNVYVAQTTAATTGGRISIKQNDVAGTSAVSIVDGAYTVESRTNSNWEISTTGITGSSVYSLAMSGSGLYETVNGNSRITTASGIFGTHQNGTILPHSQRTAIALADLTNTWYLGAANADMAFYSVASGNWEDGTTWNKGIAPSCSDSVVIHDGHVVTVNAVAANSRSVGINLTGKLVIAGNTLTVGCTMNNASIRINGNLTVNAGTVIVNGGIQNSPTGRLQQFGGAFIVDPNDNGNVSTSWFTHSFDMYATTDTSVILSGGTITIVDPVVPTAAGYCSFKVYPTFPINASTSHTLILGDGISTQPGNATNAFQLNLLGPGVNYVSLGNLTINSAYGLNRHVITANTIGILGNLTVTKGNYRMTSAHVVKGNIINNDSLTNTSTLSLASSLNSVVAVNTTAQSISGTGKYLNLVALPTAGMTNLTINNNSIGGVTLNGKLSVSGTLTLTRGIVNTTAADTFQLGSTSTTGILVGGHDSAYVNGPFYRLFGASRTAVGTYNQTTLFPVGKGGRYLGLMLDPTTNAGGLVALSAEAYNSNSGTMGAGTVTLSNIRWECKVATGNANFVSTHMLVTDSAAALTPLSKIVYAPSAAGVYVGIIPPVTYSPTPQKILYTLSQQIQAADFTGYFAYGDLVVCSTPTDQATSFTPLYVGASGFTGSFTAATSAPSHYLVVRYPNGGTETPPTNNTMYNVNTALGAGTVVANITGTTFTQTGLTASTAYDYYIYAYNNSACNGPVYNTTSPLMNTVTTCATAVIVPTATTAVNITNSAFVGRWNPIVTPGATYLVDISTNSGFTSFLPGYQGYSTSTDTFVAVTGLAANTTYYYRARAVDGPCASNVSTTQTVTTLCNPLSILPWTEGFESVAVGTNLFPSCWNYSNASSFWSLNTAQARTGTKSLGRTTAVTDGWAFTPTVTLNAGTAYAFSFYVRTASTVTPAYNITVGVGNGQAAAAMTTTLATLTNFQSTTWVKQTITFSPLVTGDYSFGTRVVATATPTGIYFDDMMIEEMVVPGVSTLSATNIAQNGATVGGNITSTGGGVITTMGVVIGTTSNPAIGDPGVIDSSDALTPVQSGNFTFNVQGLTGATLYHYRPYAINLAGTTYGPDSTFTTPAAPVAPSVSLTGKTVGVISASFSAEIVSDGGSPVIASGIVYGTTTNPAIGNPGVVDSTTNPLVTFGTYTVRPLNLIANTKYYFRAYAINGIGTTYSALDSVTTLNGVGTATPYFENFEGGAANWTSVTIGTNNDWILGTPAKTYLNGAHSGVNCWNTLLTGSYNVNNDGAVTSPILDCAGNTDTVWVSFFHKFTTEQGWDALVVEMSINGGAWTKLDNVLGTGSNYNTTLSKAWYNSTSASGPFPPPKFSSITSGVGSGSIYSSQVNGWIQSTTPLIGAQGQGNVRVRFRFGSDPSVVNEGWSLDDIYIGQKLPPSVRSRSAINITQNSATVRGEVINDGLSTITTSGVLISLTPNPAIGDPGVVDSVSTTAIQSGVYSFNLIGLTNSTTYYTRAYAINAIGTSYGADSSFTTWASAALPTVNKTPATAITVNSATLGGNISSNGGDPIFASGIVYGTSPNPSIGDPGVVDSTTTPLVALGAFSVNPTGLAHSTKYYYRAYATNSIGTAYSTLDSFNTELLITTLPYSQDFELGAASWKSVLLGTNNNWVLGTPAKTFLNGAHSGSNAWATTLTGSYLDNHNGAVVSPQFDFTTTTSDPIVRFYHKFLTEPGWDGVVVEISINGGAWTKLDNVIGTGTNYNTVNSYAWYNSTSASGPVVPPKFSSLTTGVGSDAIYASQNSGWIQSATRLTGASGQANVKFRFRFGSDASGVQEGWALDDIEVVEVNTPTTAASAVTLTTVTNTTTTLNWTNGDGQGRLVVARLTSSTAVPPSDNTMYTASGNAFGGPDSTGLGNYIIFQNNTSSVVATGLALLTDYTYDVYEYNGKYMHVKFAAAATNNGSTLPVTLTTFTATAKAKDALLNWTTASETNNRGFEIERSLDGRSFENVGFVKGAGNSSRTLNYNFTDVAAFNKSGVWYYRLKQVDFDGKFTYSQIVRVSVNTQQVTSATVHPNPFKSEYTLSFSAAKQGVAVIEMLDMQGRVVSSTQVDAAAGMNAIDVTEAQSLKAGVYFVKVTINGESQTLKLVKE